MEPGDNPIGSKSSQEDAAIRAATGQSIFESDVNQGIAWCREAGNTVTQLVNIKNWTDVKRENGMLEEVKDGIVATEGKLSMQNRFLCVGHSRVVNPQNDKWGMDVLYDNFSNYAGFFEQALTCLLYTSPSPRDQRGSRMPSSA